MLVMNEESSVAIDQFTKIRDNGEKIKNDELQTFPEAASDGDAWRQGDVYIIKRDSVPDNCKECEIVLQLAPGNTQGSRHILDSANGVFMYKKNSPNALQGPIIKTTENRTVTHPEHGNVLLGPGVYEITYQRSYAEELKRVLD